MSENKSYTTLSIYPETASKIIEIKKDVGLKNNSQAIQILIVAYDILNNTGYGKSFTEAVKQIMEVE